MNYTQIINSPKYQQWTIGAAECYKRGGVCNGCETFELIGKQCKMKASVISLVKHFGPPPEKFDDFDDNKCIRDNITNDSSELTAQETKIKDMLLQGMNYKKIADKLVISLPTVKTHVNAIFQKRHYHSLQELLVNELKNADIKKVQPQINERKEKMINNKKINDTDINYQYGKSYAPIIEAIKKGFITNADIAKTTGIDKNYLSVKYRDLYESLVRNNLASSLNGKTYLDKIVDFVNKRMSKPEEKLYIPAPGDIVTEQINGPVKLKIDTNSDKIKQLEAENEQLKARIQELENQPKQTIDFLVVKEKLTAQISELNAKLKAIELLECELS